MIDTKSAFFNARHKTRCFHFRVETRFPIQNYSFTLPGLAFPNGSEVTL